MEHLEAFPHGVYSSTRLAGANSHSDGAELQEKVETREASRGLVLVWSFVTSTTRYWPRQTTRLDERGGNSHVQGHGERGGASVDIFQSIHQMDSLEKLRGDGLAFC